MSRIEVRPRVDIGGLFDSPDQRAAFLGRRLELLDRPPHEREQLGAGHLLTEIKSKRSPVTCRTNACTSAAVTVWAQRTSKPSPDPTTLGN